MIRKIFQIQLILFLAGCVLVGQPKWFGKEISGYSSSEYFIGIGVGSDYEEALANAQRDIASQIRLGIESNINYSQEETSEGDISEIKESFESEIKTSVNETIQGIITVKKEKKRKQYYLAAALEKEKYLSGIKVEIDQLWNNIRTLVKDARKFADNGDLFLALDNYADANPYIPRFYVQKSFYDSLSDIPYGITEFITVDGIISEIRSLINKINLNVKEGNKQSAKSGSYLSKPIIIQSKFNKKNTIISNLPLKVEYDDGTTEKLVTDDSGEAELWALAFCSNGNNGRISINLDFHKFPKYYKKYFKDVRTIAKYSCTDNMPVTFSLYVDDENKKRLDKVEQKLAKSLQKIGYSVSDNAELLLEGSVSIIDENEISNYKGNMVQIKAELSLLLKVISNNKIVGSFESVFVGLGKNTNQALKKSYNKMKIDKKDLKKALSSSEDILRKTLLSNSNQFLMEGKALYDRVKYDEAMEALAQVVYGDEQISEAQSIIASIKNEIKSYQKKQEALELKEFEQNKKNEMDRIKSEKENLLKKKDKIKN